MENKNNSINYAELVSAATLILRAVGEDTERNGLIETPARVAKAGFQL